jgi:hypothetical protein
MMTMYEMECGLKPLRGNGGEKRDERGTEISALGNFFRTSSQLTSRSMAAFLLLLLPLSLSGRYKSFKVALYTRASEVIKMANRSWLESTWKLITDQVPVDKVYLETHRDLRIVNDSVMESVKRFFHDRGIETGGGITYTINESNEYETFCYSDPQHRRLVQELAELTARHHNEFILDDFFFTSCKSDGEIDAKGDRTWAQYRQALLAEAGRSLVVDPAHRVNPAVSVIIKYPNWYEHFPGLVSTSMRGRGYSMRSGPAPRPGTPPLRSICRTTSGTKSCATSRTAHPAEISAAGSICSGSTARVWAPTVTQSSCG